MAKNNNIILPDWDAISKILKYKEKDFKNLLNKYVTHKKELYQKIKSINKEDRTFENTILTLENSDEGMTNTLFQIVSYSMAHKDKNFRDMANNFKKEFSGVVVDIEYDKDIYRSIVEYKENTYKKEKNSLDKKYGEGSIKLFEDLYKGYKRMGFDLPAKERNKLKGIMKNINKLSVDFSSNIDKYKDFILCSKEEIRGLPENFVQTLTKEKGKYKITLEYPSIIPFMQYADSRKKRKELSDKDYQKGGVKNIKLLEKIISLRDEEAKILGYKNYVDFNLEDRMAKSEIKVRGFVDNLVKKLESVAVKDIKDLNNFAKENIEEYKNIKNIEYYDTPYLANKMREKKYSYDSSKIKEYFELEHILSTTFKIFGELLSVDVKEVIDKEKRKILVDKDVRMFEFKDIKTKEIISYLILDLFPRDGKYGHACSAEFIGGEYKEGKRVVPINNVICNFSKASKNLPALLTFNEVDTFFHELGHALHYMFTNSVHYAQAGYCTVFDFIETPSQMLENFLLEEDNLKRLAIHYKTKKPIEKELMKKIIKSSEFFKGYSNFRQLILTKFDIGVHTGEIDLKNIAKYYRDSLKKYFNFNLEKSAIFPAGFSHMIDYGAGYYSYLWALVYADDFYSVFKEAKNKEELKKIGQRYRKEILEVGGSRDEIVSAKKFLQRAPNNKAFLKKITNKE